MQRGKTITLTGNDLCSKSTQSKLLAKAMQAERFSFPDYNTLYGQLIRASLYGNVVELTRFYDKNSKVAKDTCFMRLNKNDMNPYEVQCLHLLSRLAAQSRIEEILSSGKHIIFDRYDVDGYVYGKAEGCDENWIESFQSCIIPSDFVLVLYGKTLKRKDEKDLNESNQDLMNKVQEEYLYQALCRDNWRVIPIADGDYLTSIFRTHLSICNAVQENLGIKVVPLNIEQVKEIVGG